jgi:glycosyltransferase involved in cell wall biosynthesis
MKLLQINTNVNTGSTGRIAEDIGKVLIANGHESYIAYGRGNRPSVSKLVKIGSDFDVYSHGLKTIVFDRHGFGSKKATINLIKKIEEIQPDAIGLHNLHGYYLNIQVLFDYLAKANIPVLWTLFDCWAFTGHCSYFDDINCIKWQTHCNNCPKTRFYPSSIFKDNSCRNFQDKKNLFKNIKPLEIVVHSEWLASLVQKSFLNDIKVHITPTGTDLNVFKPVNSELKNKYNIGDKKVILGCANIWSKRKGLDDFIKLNQLLSDNCQIVLIGLTAKQIHSLPGGILGFTRTENTNELAAWYSLAEVFVNPTYQDNFPTTNIEALACGTPVITYNTGGSPEAIDVQTGFVLEKGDINGLAAAIKLVMEKGKSPYTPLCRARAEKLFNKDDRYMDYLRLYEELI